MLLIMGHILLILGLYFFAFGLKIPLPPETSRKKVALHALWPTFGGLLMVEHRAACCTEHCLKGKTGSVKS